MKAGLVTCLGDILKTVAAVLAVKLIFGRTYTEDMHSSGAVCRFWSGARTQFSVLSEVQRRKRSCMYRWTGACSISDRWQPVSMGLLSGDQRSDTVCISRLNTSVLISVFDPGGRIWTAWDYHSSNGNPCGILHRCTACITVLWRYWQTPCQYRTSCIMAQRIRSVSKKKEQEALFDLE